MTCATSGFQPAAAEGRHLRFEKTSQLLKLMVLSFLQKSLDRMALMEEKASLFL